jgi:hypothetical protein
MGKLDGSIQEDNEADTQPKHQDTQQDYHNHIPGNPRTVRLIDRRKAPWIYTQQ